MITVIFKNLDKSELAREAAVERVESLIAKFPDLNSSKLRVTLEMHNSPLQPGPDHFTVKLLATSGRYKGVQLEKSATNLYVALADVVDHMLEKLNRAGDRKRVKERNGAREILPDWISAPEPECAT